MAAVVISREVGFGLGQHQRMVHISSARLGGAGSRPVAALGWGLGLSLGLHLVVLWPAPERVPKQLPFAGSIKAELRPTVQEDVTRSVPGSAAVPRVEMTAEAIRPKATDVGGRVAKHVGDGSRAGMGTPRNGHARPPAAVATTRQTQEVDHRVSVLVQGDALTRYRLGLAWQMRHRLAAGEVGAGPVTVELAVVLAEGRVTAVEVENDGGHAALGARAVEWTWLAAHRVPVPPELGRAPLRVTVALRFEP